MRTIPPLLVVPLLVVPLLLVAGCNFMTPPSPDPRVVQTQVAELDRAVKPPTPGKVPAGDAETVEAAAPVVLDIRFDFDHFPALDDVRLACWRLDGNPEECLTAHHRHLRRALPAEAGTHDLALWIRVFNFTAPDHPGDLPAGHPTSCTVRILAGKSAATVYDKTYTPGDGPVGKVRQDISEQRIRLKVTG